MIVMLIFATVCISTIAAVQCSGSSTQCDGCQCCPDGYLCPNGQGCDPNLCPHSGGGTTQKPPPSGGQNTIRFQNKCAYTIYVGIQNNPGKELPLQGGFRMDAGTIQVHQVAADWAGRFWPRSGCSFNGEGGHCETGDCGGRLHCGGAGGTPPVSLAEITFGGAGNQAFYDVSLVDGYNIPVSLGPTDHSLASGMHCGNPTCVHDLLPDCPDVLKTKNSQGEVVACSSACFKFHTDEYCCAGSHNTPATCNPNTWNPNYAAPFWAACPQAYAYAYDDKRATFTCQAAVTDYTIQFCL